MKKQIIAGVVLGLALSGCGASGTNPPAPSQVANVASNVLQFAVGTANLYGTQTGLNVVVTYRQPTSGFNPGASGTLVNSPSLTIPGTLGAAAGSAMPFDLSSTIQFGPGTAEAGSHTMASTSQTPGSTTVTTFGQSGGAFGMGLEPFNAMGSANASGQGSVGSPFQVAPYPLPVYQTAGAATTNAFTPWGGPPAFDEGGNGQSIVGNGNYPAGSAGVPLGIDVFAGVAPAAGSYSLTVTVPANTGTVTKTAAATIPAVPTVLGIATAPAATFNGSGGATFAFTMPTGATEALVEIIDSGNGSTNCNGASAATPIYYTIEMKASGVATLGNAAGPSGTPSICTVAQNGAVTGGAAVGDSITVYTLGFDYPFAEAEYPASLHNPSPAIAGAGGTSDITISAPGTQTST